jgi:hypothetical protein
MIPFSAIQIGFAILIALAIRYGRPHPRVALAIALNFVASVALSKMDLPVHDQLVWTGIVDIATFVAILGAGWRGSLAGLCYAAMAMAYPIGLYLGSSLDHIFSVAEVLGLIALGVIGGLDRGIRTRRHRRSTGAGRGLLDSAGNHAGMALQSGPAASRAEHRGLT